VRKFFQGFVFEIGKISSGPILKKALLREARTVVTAIKKSIPTRGTEAVKRVGLVR
jgi:hypothetical protein